MQELTASTFQSNFADSIERVISTHEPLKVTWKRGRNVVVVSADDWEQMQETLHVLQNQSLMQQIAESLRTHIAGMCKMLKEMLRGDPTKGTGKPEPLKHNL